MTDFTPDFDFNTIPFESMTMAHASEDTLHFIRLFARDFQPNEAV